MEIEKKRRCPSLGRWVEEWIEQRRAEGLRCWKDYLSICRHYILPPFGRKRLDHITAAETRAFYKQLKKLVKDEQLAPRSARNIWAVLNVLLKDAVATELITTNPCVIRKGEKIKDRDKNLTWRDGAMFFQHELELILNDDGLPFHVRCTFALLFFAGLRVGELGALKMSDLRTSNAPPGLWRLDVLHSFNQHTKVTTLTKTEVLRPIPVHPVLRHYLSRWINSEFRGRFGRAPTAEDWLMPSKCNKTGQPLQLRGDRVKVWRDKALASLGLKHRRTHDLRHSLVSIARAAGVNEKIFARITHPGSNRTAHEGYAHNIWESLCTEMLKIPVRLWLPGEQLPLWRSLPQVQAPVRMAQPFSLAGPIFPSAAPTQFPLRLIEPPLDQAEGAGRRAS